MGSKARPKRYRAITVEWIDNATTPGWRYAAEYRPLTDGGKYILTRGYLLSEDEHSITVVQSIGREAYDDGDRNYGESIQILRVCIKRMRIEKCPWVRG